LFSPALERLHKALRRLPGVGPKSAQRLALHLLRRDPDGGAELAAAITHALDVVQLCEGCRALSETPRCALCSDPRRDDGLLCVVENLADLWAVEQAGVWQGRYWVLHGRLSPLDGVGPEALGLDRLAARLVGVRELILATNTTVEGEATAWFIAEMARELGIAVSRIAFGVPLGGELETLDAETLSHALAGRRIL